MEPDLVGSEEQAEKDNRIFLQLEAAQSNRQDRSYYKSLYHFNADVELKEFQLPFLSNI